MSKLNIVPAIVFNPFKSALGSVFEKVCNDAKSFLGRLEKDIKVSQGDWKVTSTGKLKSKDGNEVQMPLNNPMSALIRFGMQLNELDKNMGTLKLSDDKLTVKESGIVAELPEVCVAWIEQMRKEHKQAAPTVETK